MPGAAPTMDLSNSCLKLRRPPSVSTASTPCPADSAPRRAQPLTVHVRSIGSLKLACGGGLLVWILVEIGQGFARFFVKFAYFVTQELNCSRYWDLETGFLSF